MQVGMDPEQDNRDAEGCRRVGMVEEQVEGGRKKAE